MRLSDVIGNLDLAIFPEIGLAFFFGVFVLVTLRALRADRNEIRSQAALPFEGDIVREETDR